MMAVVSQGSSTIRLVIVPCPRCSGEDSISVAVGRDFLYGVPGEFTAVECRRCGLRFQNPRPADLEIGRLYPSDYSPHESPQQTHTELPRTKSSLRAQSLLSASLFEQLRSTYRKLRSLLWIVRHPVAAAWPLFLKHELGYTQGNLVMAAPLARLFATACRRRAGIDLIPNSGGRLLEIGSASGGRLSDLRDLGWQDLTGIELVPSAVERARSAGFKVLCGDAHTELSKLPDESFDVIIASMVFEHLTKPFSVIDLISRKLKPGGQFLFSTIVRDSWDANHFGSYWAGYDFPRHMVFFSVEDLRQATAASFENLEAYFQNAPIDYVRSATWRLPEGRYGDRFIVAMSERTRRLFGSILARAGKTTRVSFRCVKRS
jgi:SAM-dependent methyltransferase